MDGRNDMLTSTSQCNGAQIVGFTGKMSIIAQAIRTGRGLMVRTILYLKHCQKHNGPEG